MCCNRYGLRLIPEYIILTHEHFDHIWGCNYLVNKYSTRIICSKQCAFAIRDAKRNHSLFYNQKGFIISKVDILLEDVQFKFLWEGYDFELLLTRTPVVFKRPQTPKEPFSYHSEEVTFQNRPLFIHR